MTRGRRLGNRGPRIDRRLARGILANAFAAGRSLTTWESSAVEFDWSWSVPVTIADRSSCAKSTIALRQCSHAPWPDVGMNHGRALCCLYNTFLC